MGTRSVKVLIVLILFAIAPQFVTARNPGASGADADTLIERIPVRPSRAMTGSEFAQSILNMDRDRREQAISDAIFSGNIPSFLRRLVPVELHGALPNGLAVTATIFVMSDYLSIGSDTDFIRIPMNLYTAQLIASRLGFILPTKKIVDAIYAQSAYHLTPQPLTAGPQMRSTEYYVAHNRMIEDQLRARGIPEGGLIAGHKKDVVVTNLLASHEGRIAIYGWHRAIGEPIQPLSTVHGAFYADYSHGIRLISETVLINGKGQSIYDVLRDPRIALVLSHEGVMPNPWGPTVAAQRLAGRTGLDDKTKPCLVEISIPC
jgi:hypothetical protein